MSAIKTENIADDVAAIEAYEREGERFAFELGNRGPIKIDAYGRLEKQISDSYWRHGFYVFERVVEDEELRELRADLADVFERAPHTKDALVDSRGRPAFGIGQSRQWYMFNKPLSDPDGGGPGRHPVKMEEPKPPVDAPEFVISKISGPLEIMDSCLRLYGHPKLLSIAEAINGPDFTPFSDSVIVKLAGLGTSVAWHQDGTTLWDSPEWDEGTHGFNFMFQYFGSTSANGVWVIPGSHKKGRVDIKRLMASNSGSDRLPGAVPMICQAGDVVIANRQLLHGSFPNPSPHKRVTFNFGFHRRSSVLATRKLSDGKEVAYDKERVFQSSRLIAVAIDARQQRFPDESRYVYAPLAGQEDSNRWNEEGKENIVNSYNRWGLSL